VLRDGSVGSKKVLARSKRLLRKRKEPEQQLDNRKREQRLHNHMPEQLDNKELVRSKQACSTCSCDGTDQLRRPTQSLLP
jgi:hypothetical protein